MSPEHVSLRLSSAVAPGDFLLVTIDEHGREVRIPLLGAPTLVMEYGVGSAEVRLDHAMVPMRAVDVRDADSGEHRRIETPGGVLRSESRGSEHDPRYEQALWLGSTAP